MSKIIFQDIDGPLIPLRMYFIGGRPFNQQVGSFIYDPVAVWMIKHLCQKFDAKVVLNSAHNECSYEAMKKQADFNGLGDVIHQDLKTKFPNTPDRLSAIEEWLSRHEDITEWIVIDDMPVDSSRNVAHSRQVPINYNIGMTVESFKHACHLFGETLSPIIGVGQNNYFSHKE